MIFASIVIQKINTVSIFTIYTYIYLFFSLINLNIYILGKNYPLWPCGDCVFKFDNEPRDWSQSGWAFYSSETRRYDNYNSKIKIKKCLGIIQCKQCSAQVRPKIKNYKKKIEEQIDKGCPLNN